MILFTMVFGMVRGIAATTGTYSIERTCVMTNEEKKSETVQDAKPAEDQETSASKASHPAQPESKITQHEEKESAKAQRRLSKMEKVSDLLTDLSEDHQHKWYKRKFSAPTSQKASAENKLPLGMKIFGILCCIGAVLGFATVIWAGIDTTEMFAEGKLDDMGLSSIVVTYVRLVDLIALAVVFLVFGIRLLQSARHYAALVIYAAHILLIIGASCSLMLFGVDPRLIVYAVLFVILIFFQIYLDPNLRQERIEYFEKKNLEAKKEQEDGTLGRDPSGKGYIRLDFFNLFWIFVVAAFLGDIMESIVHVTIVDPGHWQDRAGLMFGQFSPIYGFGALLMTLFLNRFYKSNIILIFFASAIIGGAFEYFVSWWMQFTYGAVAWNYTGQFLSIGGRTCGWAMGCWGLLGIAWIKILLPALLWLIDRIPWNWRYIVTAVAAIFMAVDCIMTLMALDCWYERLAGHPIDTPIQHFFDQYFNNEWMADRFQSMSIDPSNAVRGSH